jgi:hypothetical protein
MFCPSSNLRRKAGGFLCRCCFLLLFFCCGSSLFAQDTAALSKAATADSIQHKAAADSALLRSFAVRYNQTVKYASHPYFRFTAPARLPVTLKSRVDKDAVFYVVIALLLAFAFIKNAFHRYVQDLFRIFFKTTMRQRQIKEQMSQTPLPSLLLNVLFILSLGIFMVLVLQHYGLGLRFNFWVLLAYCITGLACIYLIKFISLKFFGWVFGLADAIDAYIFIVFTTNKITGILLLPLVVVVAFSFGTVMLAALVLSLLLIGGLFVYRYFLSYSTIQGQVRLSFFHFAIYFCAFEIMPLLLINKLLVNVLT